MAISVFLRQNLTNFKNFLLDLIFPKFCFGCGLEGNQLCSQCKSKIVCVKTQTCPGCGRISSSGQYCQKCRFEEILVKIDTQEKPKKVKRRRPLQGIIVASYYEEGPVKELIHNFKYNHILELKSFLAEMMANVLKENMVLDKRCLILAVPMHFLRRAQRGYNQAELLAECIVNKLNENQPEAGQPLAENFQIIKKIKRTKPQVKTRGKLRTKNLEKSFKIINKKAVSGKTIILVDDVATTGTTLSECAKVLRQAGARKVWGLVVARG